VSTTDTPTTTLDTTLTPPKPSVKQRAAAAGARARTAAATTGTQAAGAVRRHRVPASAGALAAVGATVGALLWRRRAARAKAPQPRKLFGFLRSGLARR
jgi:hypothetical protein